MKRIDALFNLHRARSGLFSEYEPGDVPYVGNGLSDNGIVGFVAPRPQEMVLPFKAVVVSAFCEATVQIPPFIACGRAGNGLVVLEPKQPMRMTQMAYIAAYINAAVQWRFSWYRQTTADRLRPILVPDAMPSNIRLDINAALPARIELERPQWRLRLGKFALGSLFDLQSGDYHNLSELPPGRIPVVSCGDANNGVSGYYGVETNLHSHKLTIALNGMNTLTAKYHPYQFATKDDVAICNPKMPLRLTTQLYIQVALNHERWRYSYYRKCFIDKLRRFKVSLPAKRGKIDEDTIQAVVESAPYWGYLKHAIGTVWTETIDEPQPMVAESLVARDDARIC